MEQKQRLTTEQIKNAMGIGFIHNKGTNAFSGRIITENGQLTAEQVRIISEAALKFGNGSVVFTVRLSVELPGINFENITAFREFVAQAGLQTGGTGSHVRPVVACKGTTCKYGLSDTLSIATEIHKRFYEGYYDIKLPHKLKIAIGGCPNNCVKPDLNDLGIVSIRSHKSETEECFKVFIGGKWGKKVRMGSPLVKLFNKNDMMDLIEKAILFYISEGKPGERFGDTVDRLGVEETEKILVSDSLLQNKEKILKNETAAGAGV